MDQNRTLNIMDQEREAEVHHNDNQEQNKDQKIHLNPDSMDQDKEVFLEPREEKSQTQEKPKTLEQEHQNLDQNEQDTEQIKDQRRNSKILNQDREVYSESEDQNNEYQDLDQRDQEEQEDLDQDQNQEEEDQDQVFSTWMQQYRTSRASEGGVSRASRRASLPCPSALSAMRLSVCAPVTAKVLIRRTSSRRLLPSHQEPITEDSIPSPAPNRRPSLIPPITETKTAARRSFRRRNVMSLSDAYSVCLICYGELNQGRTRELPCTHTFHKECIQEWLWTRTSCPTCGVQLTLQSPVHDYVQVP